MATILIIEDNTEIRENTMEILELEGYSILIAENGKIGFEMAIEKQPDVVICDIMMPVMNGYEVLQGLKKHATTNHIPLIFVTASTERKDIQMAMDMGATDYVQKPFETEILLEVLNRVLSGRHNTK